MAARTFSDVEIEREHLRDDGVEVVLAPLETPPRSPPRPPAPTA